METILGIIIIYLLFGIIFATKTYYRLLSEDDLPEDKSDVSLIFFVCIAFWIIFIPFIIYNNLKGDK